MFAEYFTKFQKRLLDLNISKYRSTLLSCSIYCWKTFLSQFNLSSIILEGFFLNLEVISLYANCHQIYLCELAAQSALSVLGLQRIWQMKEQVWLVYANKKCFNLQLNILYYADYILGNNPAVKTIFSHSSCFAFT